MREFRDGQGRAWDVTVGRESWGTLVLLFSPRGEGGPRTAPVLEAETRREAEHLLEEMDEAALRARLAASEAWTGE